MTLDLSKVGPAIVALVLCVLHARLRAAIASSLITVATAMDAASAAINGEPGEWSEDIEDITEQVNVPLVVLLHGVPGLDPVTPEDDVEL